jgi:hypothetical protein
MPTPSFSVARLLLTQQSPCTHDSKHSTPFLIIANLAHHHHLFAARSELSFARALLLLPLPVSLFILFLSTPVLSLLRTPASFFAPSKFILTVFGLHVCALPICASSRRFYPFSL